MDQASVSEELSSRKRLQVFSKFLSDIVLKDLVAGRITLNHQKSEYQAAVLFADVSGFTNLTEKLMGQYGREHAVGAEHLTFMLSDYFDHLIAVVMAHDGDVIKFAGDAMLIMFPCSDAKLGLRRATTCGVEMQRVAREVSARILQQHKVVLSLKVAVSYGDIVGLVLCGVLGRWEYAVVSDAISDVGRLGDAALSHEVLISAQNLALIEAAEVEVEARDTEVYNVKKTPKWDLAIEPQLIELPPSLEPIVRCFVPAAVASRIALRVKVIQHCWERYAVSACCLLTCRSLPLIFQLIRRRKLFLPSSRLVMDNAAVWIKSAVTIKGCRLLRASGCHRCRLMTTLCGL
jgi:class 3 adenylate cyclase